MVTITLGGGGEEEEEAHTFSQLVDMINLFERRVPHNTVRNGTFQNVFAFNTDFIWTSSYAI